MCATEAFLVKFCQCRSSFGHASTTVGFAFLRSSLCFRCRSRESLRLSSPFLLHLRLSHRLISSLVSFCASLCISSCVNHPPLLIPSLFVLNPLPCSSVAACLLRCWPSPSRRHSCCPSAILSLTSCFSRRCQPCVPLLFLWAPLFHRSCRKPMSSIHHCRYCCRVAATSFSIGK